ncbi:GM17672 [Drosophila sechellia]|uniref:GM17672 n=1 Tax=Drosophila sechellia TaxID=7238 RepID=B4IGC6_DROSE|nr:GM17672 [Drosophila sechellia]
MAHGHGTHGGHGGHGELQLHHHHGGALGSPSAMMSQMIGGSGKLLPFNNQANAVYEVHDWWQEQVLCPQTSDDEI